MTPMWKARQRAAYAKMWKDAERNRRKLRGDSWYKMAAEDILAWIRQKVPLVAWLLLAVWLVYLVIYYVF